MILKSRGSCLFFGMVFGHQVVKTQKKPLENYLFASAQKNGLGLVALTSTDMWLKDLIKGYKFAACGMTVLPIVCELCSSQYCKKVPPKNVEIQGRKGRWSNFVSGRVLS